MSRAWLQATIGFGALFAGLFGAVAALAPQPRLLWNASASVPVGLYRLVAEPRPAPGDLVAIAPPAPVAALLARRGYLPRGVPLLKRVAAAEGALVCRSGSFVTIDGAFAGRVLTRDRAGRPLPYWIGCRQLRSGELFLLGSAPGSLDSRYFGALPAAGVVGIAHPLLVRDAPGARLRWRTASARAFASPQTEGGRR
ncbi:S26 family signal peptidase [Sphingopyxis sp.]|uniref:S26 family signal peptidase n=1 Tax=Sphingopyxis sp. TaxID=1908224 RepID=UPI002D7978FD|nr:S26 family signal peptidase [Sphingopyxis sp.]HET6523547.1 S26 family signal peptidase [Sphingopyxis sp.]